MHRLNINPDARPVKQQQRRFHPEIMEQIQLEVKKLMDSGCIREEQHANWVPKIVPITKKNGKIQLCIDFRDLNEAYPKDEFPFSITYVMIDNTCGFERMSFMDGFSAYNQIKMYPDDEKHTFFRTPLGVYCYTVMPFELKNTGATYQRALNAISRAYTQNSGMLHRRFCSEKPYQRRSHSRSKDSIRYHAGASIEDESHKFFLGVTSGKFLRFVITSKGIHLDLEKVRAVKEMQPPKNLRELRELQG